MNPAIADGVGIAGGVILVAGYAYSNLARPPSMPLFNLFNLVGAVLMIVSLLVHFNLASMLLEIVWGLIAALGLAKGLLGKAGR